jgi:integrase/recombinase XerD
VALCLLAHAGPAAGSGIGLGQRGHCRDHLTGTTGQLHRDHHDAPPMRSVRGGGRDNAFITTFSPAGQKCRPHSVACAPVTPLAAAAPGELPPPPTPRPPQPSVLADQLLTQTRGEHPVLAGTGEREQLLTATWLAGHRSPATRAACPGPGPLAGLAGRLPDRCTGRAHPARPAVHPRPARCRCRVGQRQPPVGRPVQLYAHCAARDLVAGNPTAGVRRAPLNPDHTSTVGLSREQARALLAAAEADRGAQRYRSTTAVRLLIGNGLRVAELTGANLTDLGHDRGHRVLVLTRKGGHRATAALAPATATALDRYLQHRAATAGLALQQLTTTEGPLLATTHGHRLDQAALWRLIRRLARAAGIPHWTALSPHSLRHTAITLALDAGVSLRDVQDYAGHANPRTTRQSTPAATWTATPPIPSPPTSPNHWTSSRRCAHWITHRTEARGTCSYSSGMCGHGTLNPPSETVCGDDDAGMQSGKIVDYTGDERLKQGPVEMEAAWERMQGLVTRKPPA